MMNTEAIRRVLSASLFCLMLVGLSCTPKLDPAESRPQTNAKESNHQPNDPVAPDAHCADGVDSHTDESTFATKLPDPPSKTDYRGQQLQELPIESIVHSPMEMVIKNLRWGTVDVDQRVRRELHQLLHIYCQNTEHLELFLGHLAVMVDALKRQGEPSVQARIHPSISSFLESNSSFISVVGEEWMHFLRYEEEDFETPGSPDHLGEVAWRCQQLAIALGEYRNATDQAE